jgi:hypothetical protein
VLKPIPTHKKANAQVHLFLSSMNSYDVGGSASRKKYCDSTNPNIGNEKEAKIDAQNPT